MKPWGREFLLVIFLLAVMGLFPESVVLAQEKATKEEAALEQEGRKEYELETITVTAEKREENIQDVPASVSALSEVQIEDAGINSTFDIDTYVPNFRSFEQASRVYWSCFSIRGITNTAFGDPALTMYIDDVPTSDFYDFNNSLFDIKRIEVLRGPQGTLYGQNTEAGVINIITKKPGNTWEGSVKAEIGDFDSHGFRAGIRGPIIKGKLFFGLSGLYNERDGYIENIFDGQDVDYQETTSGRGQVRWTPTEKWDFQLTISGEDYNDGGWSYIPWDKTAYQTMYGSHDLDDFECWQDHIGKADLSRNSQSLRISYELPRVDIVSITARKHLESEDTLDADFSPFPLYIGFDENDTKQWSQEIRLSSPKDSGPFTWVAGGFYSNKDCEATTGYMSDMVGAFGYGLPSGTKMEYDADFDAETYAVFGQGTYRIFDDKFGLTSGLRCERAERAMNRDILFAGSPTVPNQDVNQSNTEWLPKFAVDYRFTPDFMTYVSAARGYKAGGFSHAVQDPDYLEFDPETIWTYELGVKSIWFDKKLMLNLTGFYSDVDDYQDRVGISAMEVAQANAANATIWGFEAELMFRPIAGFDITGSFGYLNAEYDDYLEPASGEDFSGKEITLTPDYEYSLAAQYRLPFGLYLRAEAEGNSGFYFDRANQYKQESYILYHAKIGYEYRSFDLYIFGKNLGDKQYHTSGGDFGGGLIMGNVGAPRTIGGILTYRF